MGTETEVDLQRQRLNADERRARKAADVQIFLSNMPGRLRSGLSTMTPDVRATLSGK